MAHKYVTIYGALDACLSAGDSGMEDAHTTVLKLDDSGNAFFAVFDGHGGTYLPCAHALC